MNCASWCCFSADNIPSFRACSQLLSSVSGYQYSRKAWRKEGLELLLDPNFFMMDPRSLASWKVVVDNLLTHDRTTFKDLMSMCQFQLRIGILEELGEGELGVGWGDQQPSGLGR